MTLLSTHVHVSEREIAHVWPDGRKDDGAWEDCTFCTAVELARLCHDPAIPATHAEAEMLRAVSGRAVLGGTNQGDVLRAFTARYSWTAGIKHVAGWPALWAALGLPGQAASVMGRTGAFPVGHRLRRWDPTFMAGHCLLVIRLDDTDRVWWCDPLAPLVVTGKGGARSTYNGEWVTRDELRTYVDALPSGEHLAATVLSAPKEAEMPTLLYRILSPAVGTVTVAVDGEHIITPDNRRYAATKGEVRDCIAKVELLKPLDAHPGDRQKAWLVGKLATEPTNSEIALLLEYAGTFTPATAADANAAVNRALDQVRANATAAVATAAGAAIDAAVTRARPPA